MTNKNTICLWYNGDAVTSKDPAIAKRAFDARMTMTKIDMAAIEAAIAGD